MEGLARLAQVWNREFQGTSGLQIWDTAAAAGSVSGPSPIWPVPGFNWARVWPFAWAFVTAQAARKGRESSSQ